MRYHKLYNPMRVHVMYAQDKNGRWVAHLPDYPNLATALAHGKTISKTERRVKAALSLYLGPKRAEAAELVSHYSVPKISHLLDAVTIRREALTTSQREYDYALARAFDALRAGAFEVTDIARLTGLSEERVRQKLDRLPP